MKLIILVLIMILSAFLPVFCIFFSKTTKKLKIALIGAGLAIGQNFITYFLASFTSATVLSRIFSLYIGVGFLIFGVRYLIKKEIIDHKNEAGMCLYGGYGLINLGVTNFISCFPIVSVLLEGSANPSYSTIVSSIDELSLILMLFNVVLQYLLQRTIFARAIMTRDVSFFTATQLIYHAFYIFSIGQLLMFVIQIVFYGLLVFASFQTDKIMSK